MRGRERGVGVAGPLSGMGGLSRGESRGETWHIGMQREGGGHSRGECSVGVRVKESGRSKRRVKGSKRRADAVCEAHMFPNCKRMVQDDGEEQGTKRKAPGKGGHSTVRKRHLGKGEA